MALKKSIGLEAEELACKFLRQQGYRILEKRYRTKFGELDLICRKKRELIFVEVRSVETDSGIQPEETILPKKIEHIVKSAKFWILKKGLKNLPARFDVITIDLSQVPPQVNHYPSAFESELDL